MKGILPEEVLWRKKSPYPKTHDPRYSQIVADRLRELIEDSSRPVWYMVDRESARQLLTSEHVWPWYGQLMRGPQTMAFILQIDYWLRKYRIDFTF